MHRLALWAAALAWSGAAYAQNAPVQHLPNPVSMDGAVSGLGITNFQQQLAPRLNMGVSMMGGTYSAGTNQGFFGTGGAGHTGQILFEIPDDATAFQLVVSNQNDNGTNGGWTITNPVMTTSSSYGAANNPGTVALDTWGNAVTAGLPFQYASAGANTSPIAGLAGVSAAGIPAQVQGLALTGSTVAGGGTLTFATTHDGRANGATDQAASGWFVADGLGCIAAGVTVNTVSNTQITLTGNGAAPVGCLSGQAIYLSPAPFSPFSRAVPALTATGPIPVVYSDWLPIQTVPRADGGFTVGGVMTVSGTNIPANTTLTSVTPVSLVLSQAISGTVAAKATITLSVNQTVDAALDGFRFTLKKTAGVKVGQSVTGTGVQAGSVVMGVTPAGVVTISQSTPAISTIAQGASLTFSNTIFTTNTSTASGNVLPVNSTSSNRLVVLRFFTGATDFVSLLTQACGSGRCQQGLGLPPILVLTSGTAIDGVNVWGAITGTTGGSNPTTIMPNFALRYVTAHRAVTTLGCGGYQAMGIGTATANASALTLASAALSTPSVPVTAINAGNSGSSSVWLQRCSEWIKAAQPGIVDLWTYTDHPTASGASLSAGLYSLQQQVMAYGGRVILSTDAPEQTTQIGGIFVPAAVSGTVMSLTLGSNDFPYGGSGYLVTGTGIPTGTTATFSAKPGAGVMYPTLTFSQAVNIPANSTITLGYQVLSGSSGTTVTLAYPSPLAVAGAQMTVSGPAGIVAGTTGTVSLNGTTLTLSQAGTVNAGDTLILSHFDLSAKQITSRNWPQTMGLSGATPVRDNMADDDPANLAFKRIGASFAGIYNSDYGESLWQAREQAIISKMIGN